MKRLVYMTMDDVKDDDGNNSLVMFFAPPSIPSVIVTVS